MFRSGRTLVFAALLISIIFIGSITGPAQSRPAPKPRPTPTTAADPASPQPTPAKTVAASDASLSADLCTVDLARTLVEQQADEAGNVQQPKKRVQILVRTASFLWKYDEPKARELFADAFNFAVADHKEKMAQPPPREGVWVSPTDYRQEVLRAISSRDPKWARELSVQMVKEMKELEKAQDGRNRRLPDSILLDLAVENVKTDPELSRYFLRQMMTARLDSPWFEVFQRLGRSDTAFADSIYSEALAHYANELPRRLLYLSAYPLGSDRVLGPERMLFSMGDEASAATLRPALLSAFLRTFLERSTAWLADPNNLDAPPERPGAWPETAYILVAAKQMAAIAAQNEPELASRFTALESQANAFISDKTRADLAQRDEYDKRRGASFDEQLDELEKAESEGKLTDAMIVRMLLMGAFSWSEPQFAKFEPWLLKIRDSEGRPQVSDHFWYTRGSAALKDDRFADTRRSIGKILRIEDRGLLAVELAAKQAKGLSPSDAYQTLGEVSRMADSAPNSAESARIHLALADLYSGLNRTVAISELSDAVRIMNALDEPDVLSTTVARTIRVDRFSGMTMRTMPGLSMENAFKVLSKTDFDLPLSNAKGINDRFLRTIAVIAVAQNCADRPKAKPAKVPARPVKN